MTTFELPQSNKKRYVKNIISAYIDLKNGAIKDQDKLRKDKPALTQFLNEIEVKKLIYTSNGEIDIGGDLQKLNIGKFIEGLTDDEDELQKAISELEQNDEKIKAENNEKIKTEEELIKKEGGKFSLRGQKQRAEEEFKQIEAELAELRELDEKDFMTQSRKKIKQDSKDIVDLNANTRGGMKKAIKKTPKSLK